MTKGQKYIAALMKEAKKRNDRAQKEAAANFQKEMRKEKALMLKALKRSQRLERTAEHRRRIQETYDRRKAETKNWNPSMTKAQKREKSRKASVQRRVVLALAKFLKQANPAMKTAGAKVTRLKGGGFNIRPIKAVKRGKR